MILGHGGNLTKAARELGCDPADICDMSSNMNPLGPPPGLMDHLKKRMDLVLALPEPDACACVAAFCRWHKTDPRRVRAANGTTQFIHLLPAAVKPGRAVIAGPTYADYTDACITHGAETIHLTASADLDFRLDEEALIQEARSADLVFICNPNNPTGTLRDAGTLRRLCRMAPRAVFVVDESYLPFAPGGLAHSLIRDLPRNAVVLNSMSKMFRIPGLRMGFLAAGESILERLDPLLMPWSVNALAQEAVVFLEANKAEMDRFQEKTRQFLAREKERFFRQLANARNLRLFESRTGFVLGALAGGLDAKTVCARMLARGILIRNCANFKGLDDRFIRISLKNEAQNQKAALCLKQAVA